MGRFDSSKSFASIHIHDDYAFFQEHSTEAEQDLRSHLAYLLPLVKSGKTVRLLDFGCGDGLFTARCGTEQSLPTRLSDILPLAKPIDFSEKILISHR